MSEGVNRVTLLGNLGNDPDYQVTANGTSVMKLSLATNERYKASNGEWTEKVEWHRVTIWGKRAENLAKILAKGDQLYVEGRLETSKYEKDGETRYSTCVVVLQVIPLKYTGQKGDERGSATIPQQESKTAAATPRAQHRQTSFKAGKKPPTDGNDIDF